MKLEWNEMNEMNEMEWNETEIWSIRFKYYNSYYNSYIYIEFFFLIFAYTDIYLNIQFFL